VLRNLGLTTIVPVGVSLNETLLGLCINGASLAYRIALPTDAVAGYPREFSRALLEHAFRLLATLTTTDAVATAWMSGLTKIPAEHADKRWRSGTQRFIRVFTITASRAEPRWRATWSARACEDVGGARNDSCGGWAELDISRKCSGL
jgi:hypothetical protein